MNRGVSLPYFEQTDLHGLTAQAAKEKLDETMNKLPSDTHELTVIHGYRSGTALRDMVRRYKHKRIERKILGLNQGSTVFIIRRDNNKPSA